MAQNSQSNRHEPPDELVAISPAKDSQRRANRSWCPMSNRPPKGLEAPSLVPRRSEDGRRSLCPYERDTVPKGYGSAIAVSSPSASSPNPNGLAQLEPAQRPRAGGA